MVERNIRLQIFTTSTTALELFDAIANTLIGIDTDEIHNASQEIETYIKYSIVEALYGITDKITLYADEMVLYYGTDVITIADQIVLDLLSDIQYVSNNNSFIEDMIDTQTCVESDSELNISVVLFDPKWSNQTVFLTLNFKG